MLSLAGNQAFDQPIPQLCSWDAQAAPAALAWDAGMQLGARSRRSSRPGLWMRARWQVDSAALGLGSSGGALCLENGQPAGPVLGERAAGRASGPVLGGPIQLPWA